MQRRFAIVSQGRSGSTYLQKLLDSHPDIACFGELLRPADEDQVEYLPVHYDRESKQDVGAFLEEYYLGLVSARAIGYKSPWEWNRVYPDVWGTFRANDYRLIFLRRENKLDQYLSRQLAIATGIWRSEKSYPDTLTIPIEIEHLLWFLRYTEFVDFELETMCKRFNSVEVRYESLMDSGEQATIQKHLNVEPLALVPGTVKGRDRPIHEMIENFGEVWDALSQSAYRRFLDPYGSS